VLVTISVPASSPIDAAMPEQEAAAASVIEEAKVQVGRRVTGHYEKVRAGQTGRRIVDEAKEMRAGAIVLEEIFEGKAGRSRRTVSHRPSWPLKPAVVVGAMPSRTPNPPPDPPTAVQPYRAAASWPATVRTRRVGTFLE